MRDLTWIYPGTFLKYLAPSRNSLGGNIHEPPTAKGLKRVLFAAMADRLDRIADSAGWVENLAGSAQCRLRRRMLDEINSVRLATFQVHGTLAEQLAAQDEAEGDLESTWQV